MARILQCFTGNSVPAILKRALFKKKVFLSVIPLQKPGKQMMILKLWLLGCACICSSKISEPLGGKISLEGDNGISGSLFYRDNVNCLSGTHLSP